MVCLYLYVCLAQLMFDCLGKLGFSEAVLKVKTFLAAEGQLLDQEGLLGSRES